MAAIPSMQGRKLRNIKLRNHKAVINTLRQMHALPISDISKQIGLSNTAVSKIIANLLDKGLLSMEGKGSSTGEGGKRPELYSINKTYRYGIVVCAEPDDISCYIYDLSMRQLAVVRYHISMITYQSNVLGIVKCIKEAMSAVDGVTPETLCGIAISYAGIIDSQNGRVDYPIHTPQWGAVLPFSRDIQALLGFQTDLILENNCRFCGYGELFYANHCNLSSYATIAHLMNESITITEGVGGSVVYQRQLLHGKHNFVGEFGHITICDDDPQKCSCGRYGCFQIVTACLRVIKKAREFSDSYTDSLMRGRIVTGNLSIYEVFDASNRGDELACMLMDEVACHYARLIEHIILTHDPDKVIIQGIYAMAGDYFLSRVRTHLLEHSIFNVTYADAVAYTKHAFAEQVPLGAALFLFDRFLNQDALYE